MGVSLLDNILGGMLAGTWVNSMLLAVEFLQVYKYFRSYPNDPRLLRLSVAFLLVLNVECTIGNYANVYLFCVTHWGDQTFLVSQYWPVPNYVVTTAVSAFIAQTFLVWRFWRLSTSYVLSGILWVFSLASLAGAIALAIIIVSHSSLSERNLLTTTATIWFVASAATDVSISIVLIWEFRRMRSFFDNTRSLIQRLISLTIRSGTVTSTVALTSLFLFLADKEANWATGVVFTMGPIYALTMLSNLNARRRLHGAGHTSDGNEPTGQSSGGGGAVRRGHEETFAMSGIHVIRTVQLSDDQNRNLKLDASFVPGASVEAEEDSLEDRKRRPYKQQSVGAAV